ncbi:MAG: hypothetical protein HOO06_14115 [Bdellovibrionaceae bacterium]|jgi:hypothetical protein|nr:hypothetical protein [Pseudobdellovibrionaceae bacterium]
MTNPLVQKIILLMTLLAGLLIQYKDLHAKNKFPQQPHLNQVSTKDFTKQQIFPPNSNLFILSKFQIKEDLFLIKVEVKNRNTSSKKYWLQVDMNNLPGKLLTNDLRDLLAFPTHNLYNAYYINTTREVILYSDSLDWNNIYDNFSEVGDPEHLKHKFKNKLTSSGSGKPILTTDRYESCPIVPQKRNGELCIQPLKQKQVIAYTLNKKLKEFVIAASKEAGIEPELLAAMIHQESHWNPFLENTWEKKICKNKDKNSDPKEKCSDYRWSRGLGQFGKSISKTYGIDWGTDSFKFQRPKACGRNYKKARSLACTNSLIKLCKIFENEIQTGSRKAMPFICPESMIHATAQHLKDAFMGEIPVWITDTNGKIIKEDIHPLIFKSSAESMRARIAYFHRGVRLINSYVDFYDTNGDWPKTYGEAWAGSQRRDESKTEVSEQIGYDNLNRHFINRCHIWKLAGLCGEIPKESLIGKYKIEFAN